MRDEAAATPRPPMWCAATAALAQARPLPARARQPALPSGGDERSDATTAAASGGSLMGPRLAISLGVALVALLLWRSLFVVNKAKSRSRPTSVG